MENYFFLRTRAQKVDDSMYYVLYVFVCVYSVRSLFALTILIFDVAVDIPE